MPENPVAVLFRNRLEAAFERSEYDSRSALSKAAGLSRPVVQNILSGAFDHSAVGPGVWTSKKLANAAGTTVGHLLGEDLATDITSQSFFSGTARSKSVVEKLMETHWRGAGRHEAFDQLIDDCDEYEVPTDDATTPQIIRVGKRTLFCARLGGPFIRDAQAEIDQLDPQKKLDVMAFHRRVVAEETAIGNSFLSHSMVTRPARVSAPNVRLGLLVENNHGVRSILLHTIPIPA